MIWMRRLVAVAPIVVLLGMPALAASLLANVAAVKVLAHLEGPQAVRSLSKARPCTRWHATVAAWEPTRFGDEERLYSEALRFDIASGAAKRGLARVYLLRGDNEHALAALEERVRADSYDEVSRLWLGEMHWNAGRHEAAGNTWRSLSSFVETLELRGAQARDRGKLDDALVCYEELLEVNGPDPDALVGLGRILSLQHQPAAALPYLERAIAVHPESSGQLPGAFRAEQLLILGRSAEAIQGCNLVYESGVMDFYALSICGNVATATVGPAGASQFWLRALAVSPSQLNPYLQLAQLARWAGNEAQAVEWCERARKLFPDTYRIGACAASEFNPVGDAVKRSR